jgi:hypothetical protein
MSAGGPARKQDRINPEWGASVTFEIEGLVKELDELHRGRGVHRPQLGRHLGPHLAQVLGIEPDADHDEVRRLLLSGLSEAARTLPRSLRLVFVFASGLGAEEHQLTDRMDLAAREVDRGQRQVRRWLREADALVAEALARQAASYANTPDIAKPGWYIESFSSVVRLDRPQPQFVGMRQICALISPLKTLTESISIPRSVRSEEDDQLQVAAVDGCTVVDFQRASTSSWRYTLELDRSLRAGERCQLGVMVTMPSRHYMRPYSVMVPFRTTRRFSTEVHLGEPRAAAKAWRLTGVPPVMLEDAIPTSDVYDLTQSSVVRADFPTVTTGLAHGIQWEWAPLS